MNDRSHAPGERLASAAPTKDPLLAVLGPALKVGAACGSAGFLLGGAAGIIRGTTPALFATASGLQTFALGTTFWGCRTGILQAWTVNHQTPSDLTKASTLSGGFTGGAIALLTRGRSNVLPGAVMFALFGFVGQAAYNQFSAPPDPSLQPKKPFWNRIGEKSWTPFTVLSNEEYVAMLKEKMLKVDVEIAILDDKMVALRKQQEALDRQGDEESTAPPVEK